MELANSRQQTNTEIIMDTQTEVKEFVQDAVTKATMIFNFNQKVLALIDKGLKDINDKELKDTARSTLFKFAVNEYQRQVNLLGLGLLPVVLAFYKRKDITDVDVRVIQNNITKQLQSLKIRDLHKAYSQLGNSQAKVSYSQSLYGRAELKARYDEQVEMVNNLKEKTNLVICDTHSDCSKRCSKWQGRIYSLDGTTGFVDGKKYIPLEVATQQVDKYGNVNGLLGYNCRHKLHPYKTGMKAIKVSEKERKREYALTKQQRTYERTIREYKDKALGFQKGMRNEQFSITQRDYMRKQYELYKFKTQYMTNSYKKFCQDNNRVEYRSRLKI